MSECNKYIPASANTSIAATDVILLRSPPHPDLDPDIAICFTYAKYSPNINVLKSEDRRPYAYRIDF